MGTLFMVNPPRRKSRKRRTPAQQRATRKMIAANRRRRKAKSKRYRRNPLTAAQRLKRYRRSLSVGQGARKRRRTTTTSIKRRKRKGSATMARKRKTRRSTSRKRRSTARRRSGVQTLRRHSVYLTNPRRRRRHRVASGSRRRRYRRNPAIFAQVKQGVMDAGATLAGGAAARVVGGMLPLPKDGLAGVASGLAVALGVGILSRKVVSHDTARFITAGAMQVPVKALITTFVPGAGAYLGDYDNIGAYAVGDGMGNYLSPGMYGAPEQSDVEIGVYE